MVLGQAFSLLFGRSCLDVEPYGSPSPLPCFADLVLWFIWIVD